MIKRAILNENFVKLFFSEQFSFSPDKHDENLKNFIIGNKYSLGGEDCDDFKMPLKEYILIGEVSNVNGIDVDSLIMKQVSGNVNTIFSLTKSDCKLLNIDFESGLQLFPKNLNWNKVSLEETNDIDNFDENNLSKYPTDYIDKTIRNIIIKISNCEYIPNLNLIKMQNKKYIKYDNFLNSLKLKTIRPLYGDGITSSNYRLNENINYRVITQLLGNCTTNNIVDKNGDIYLELILCKKKHNSYISNRYTEDGLIGIKPEVFDNEPFYNIFEISYYYLDENVYDNKRLINKNINRMLNCEYKFDIYERYMDEIDKIFML